MATYMQPILSLPAARQDQSPLFSRIPAELRSEIFALALADYPDPSPDSRYAAETCYTRPSYFAPRKSDTRLLRTCRAVYQEAWFLPFVLREQTHWLTSSDRAPPEYDPTKDLNTLISTLDIIAEQHGTDHVETNGLRVFAQMWALERKQLAIMLRMLPRLRPRSLTLTIRHADWWWWESDQPLRFEGDWIWSANQFLPPSVREFHIELESVQRKKEQVDSIARQMAERWVFKRTDGVALFADASGAANTVDTWTGSSTWNDETWTRDESRPGQIDYYILSVVFRPRHAVERRGGHVSPLAARVAEQDFAMNRHELRLIWVPPAPDPRLAEQEEESNEGEEDGEEDEEEDEEAGTGHEDEETDEVDEHV
ncbi:hypothetical protein NEMBOFW57_001233 [Staphylotrichum longicolle]|uniref:Uncharacterized protein n=1 Tax=Staphylotrichum longicolle TaxID=669026 RepID=A0AAD4F0S7_9PEZI|nr:hypothetical protein NEMBOFW57_001233 [Staphylotrichum longicolle]